MAKFVLGSIRYDMPTNLDVSSWSASTTATSGTAYDPGRPGIPFPGFRQDRIEFTGTGLAYDGGSDAFGTIKTLVYKHWGLPGYFDQFTITGLNVSFQQVLEHKTDLMPLLLQRNDSIIGNAFDNVLYGFAGNDSLEGGAGNDRLFGGDGNDLLTGGAGQDYLDGGAGTDTASYAAATSGVFVDLSRGKGLAGEARGDTFVSIENIRGSNFKDTLVGDKGHNAIFGLGGNDWIDGGSGNDKLYGDAGNDTIIGGAGNDHIYSGTGDDTIWLGSGRDVFHFAPGEQTATIHDFEAGQDRIDLSGFSGVTAQNYQSLLHDTANGLVIDPGSGDQITLVGLDSSDVKASDFLF